VTAWTRGDGSTGDAGDLTVAGSVTNCERADGQRPQDP
jgi:hypothetical protein